MRKENSDLITEYVTDAGNYKKNRDYFGFVEMDNKAIWVLSDGIDSIKEELSSEIAVSRVLSDFSENPSMKKRHLKKYIKNANKALLNESGSVPLMATLLIVVTDYTRIRTASVGNTRLYHLKNDKIKYRTKDHSLAQMMVEAGKSDPRTLNQHEERNNLSQYLGEDKKVKPRISKKRELKESDVLVLCSSGFWENIRDKEIEDIVKDQEEAKSITEELEKLILERNTDDLNNYTITTILAKKVFKEDVNPTKKWIKRILIGLAIILLIVLIIFGVKMCRKHQRKEEARQEKAEQTNNIKAAKDKEKEGDKYYLSEKYNQALDCYKTAQNTYKKFRLKEKIKEIKMKIKDVENILAGRKLEKEGDENFSSENYKQSKKQYIKAESKYKKASQYQMGEIKNKIQNAKNVVKAKKLETAGDNYYKNKNYKKAYKNYKQARILYEGVPDQSLKSIDRKLGNAEAAVKGIELIKRGDSYFKTKDYKNAKVKYKTAKDIFNRLGAIARVDKINSKLSNIKTAKIEDKAKKMAKKGNEKFDNKKWNKAIENYEKAEELYNKIDKYDKAEKMEKKIKQAQKKKKILGLPNPFAN